MGRDPNERDVLERASVVALAVIEAIPPDEDGADTCPPVGELDDVQVVACGFSLVCGDLAAMLKAADEAADRPTVSRCAWCVDAAADEAGRRAVPALPWAEAREHVHSCEHNPMVAELARLRGALEEACELAKGACGVLVDLGDEYEEAASEELARLDEIAKAVR